VEKIISWTPWKVEINKKNLSKNLISPTSRTPQPNSFDKKEIRVLKEMGIA